MTVATVYAVFADKAEAERIGRDMIERRLAACVNILAPCTSIYRWQGAVETAGEVPALFKTSAMRARHLVDAITAAHSYDLPAVEIWAVNETPGPLAGWIEQSVS